MSRLALTDEPTERALLGACLLDPALVPCLMHVRDDDFADPRRATLWSGMRSHGGGQFSASSLAARLAERCTREVRDELRLVEESTFSSVGTAELADQLCGLATRRRIARAGQRLVEASGNATMSPAEVVARAHAEMLEATARTGRSQPVQHAQLLAMTYELLQRIHAAHGGLTGAPTSLQRLDALTSGMQAAELWVLAARPGCGKTALALSIAHSVAKSGRAVAFASLEMPLSQLGVRCVAAASGLSQSALRRGRYTEAEYEALEAATSKLHGLPILSWDDFGIGLSDLRSLALQTRASFGSVGLVIVDYLQLMAAEDRRAPREQQVAAIARGLKALSKELACPVLALSQLSRDGVKTKRKPQLSDLRESGSIEQDADTVLFLHREEDAEPDAGGFVEVELLIGKQRNGPTGSVSLSFHGPTMRFEEAKA